jgi:predicted amidohydrolase YtcJ
MHAFSKAGYCYLLAALGLHAACTQQTPKQPTQNADLVLFNGAVFTADSSNPRASAIAIKDGLILHVGTDAEIDALAGEKTERIDLQGAFAMPGLIEGHGHFSSLGRSLQNLNLMQSKTWREITEQVAEKAKNTPEGEWIEGRGWHQEKWTEPAGPTVNGYPYHELLSAASPIHPVVLYHASGHGLMANAKAMELAGISRESADPVGGRIVRDARGNLTGVFEENAMDLVEAPFGQWKSRRTEEERRAAFEKSVELAAQECLAKGITSFQDAGSSFWELDEYRRLAETGKLPLRLWAMISQPRPQDLPKLSAYPQTGLGKGYFSCRAVKGYMDGALGSYGAWLLAPYADKPGHLGQNVTPVDTIAAIAAACRRYGLQFCVHAIGDRANREVLDIYRAAIRNGAEAGPAPDLRWRIEHAQHIDPADQPRFRDLGVIASMQAIHCTSDAPFVVKRLGRRRAQEGAYSWKRLLAQGVRMANGTDAPVEDVDPLPSIYASVTRKHSPTDVPFFPEHNLTREEALLSYTLWNAYAAFEEKEKGSLQKGKMADITVLDKNLLECAPDEIPAARVRMTIVGGALRFGKK